MIIHLIGLLRVASNLKYLGSYECPKITNSVIDAAIEVTKQRTNNIMLEIEGIKISDEETVKLPPLLHLLNE